MKDNESIPFSKVAYLEDGRIKYMEIEDKDAVKTNAGYIVSSTRDTFMHPFAMTPPDTGESIAIEYSLNPFTVKSTVFFGFHGKVKPLGVVMKQRPLN